MEKSRILPAIALALIMIGCAMPDQTVSSSTTNGDTPISVGTDVNTSDTLVPSTTRESGSPASGSSGPQGSGTEEEEIDTSDAPVTGTTAGGRWTTFSAGTRTIVPGTWIELVFVGNRIDVYSGCAWLTGEYTIVEGRLITSELVATSTDCPTPLLDQQTWIATFLQAGPSYIDMSDGIELALPRSEQESISLGAVGFEMRSPLNGTNWTLYEIVSGNTPSSVPFGVQATLEIMDNEITLSTGCQTMTGKVTVVERTATLAGQITVPELVSTNNECDDAHRAVEATLRNALDGAADYFISGRELSVAADGVELVFSATLA